MSFVRIATASLFATCLFWSTALHAQDISADDRVAIEARIAEFDGAMKDGDMAAIFGFTPPRLTAHIADKYRVTVEQLQTGMTEQISAAMETVTVASFGMDIDAAIFAATPDGSRTYGLISTETLMAVNDAGKMQATSQTLALKDEGNWYLLRVDDANQDGLIREVYPEFADIEFPPGSMQAVK